MKLFFGKISNKYDTKQIQDGYYQAPKDTTWYNGIDVGDYAFIIGGDKIQLWKAKKWGEMPGGVNDKLEFEVIISDIRLKTKGLIALKYLKLNVDLIIKTTKSTGGEQKAFFELAFEAGLTEELLLNPLTYQDDKLFRDVKLLKDNSKIDSNTYDIQLYFENNELKIAPINNCEEIVAEKFKDNLGFIGKGKSKKDKVLAIVKAQNNLGTNLGKKGVTILDVYESFMCKYIVEPQDTNYWVLNGYDSEKIEYDIENDTFVMYYQYGPQGIGEVTTHLNLASKIKEGDKVLLYNQNRYYGHATFVSYEEKFDTQITLKEQVGTRIKHNDGILISYTDAPCYFEDLRNSNGFKSQWGQRFNIEEWENVHPNGIHIPGISDHTLTFGRNSIIQLKDDTFYNLVKNILSGDIKNPKEHKRMMQHIELLKFKKQIILQGPPGTGKTYTAKRMVQQITGSDNEEQNKIIQFHPSYSYEDFVRGITVQSKGEGIEYVTVNKMLGKLAKTAADNPTLDYTLIIDEINRANLPSVLGELIYALEYRGKFVESMYAVEGDASISIPKNLFIIGTMNTADRSVGHIDYAIKRRFAFVDVLPDEAPINNVRSKELFKEVSKLFVGLKDGKRVNSNYMAPDFNFKDIQLGHSYFILEKGDDSAQLKELKMRLEFEVIPILNEYVKDGLLLETAKAEINRIAGLV
jgi:hypothetical protein